MKNTVYSKRKHLMFLIGSPDKKKLHNYFLVMKN